MSQYFQYREKNKEANTNNGTINTVTVLHPTKYVVRFNCPQTTHYLIMHVTTPILLTDNNTVINLLDSHA